MTPAAAAADVDVCLVDLLPVYVKELIAGGAAGRSRKLRWPLSGVLKIIMQVANAAEQTRNGLSISREQTYAGIKDLGKVTRMVELGLCTEVSSRANILLINLMCLGSLDHSGIFAIMHHHQGWRQLFAGLSLNYMKVVPSVAIGFTAYDMMKSALRVPPRQA
ncbi:hypothetical protein HPP92_011469 [Vanilla planifolia]|uniref:Uncharacterized protein n=1 Tax=Vanilla planifolia TaxID=51239 RepID=A0A835V2E1_VANPL|nr:hypothetical protein HPP92_011469 [Vanilla planifolia]